jgi:acyl-CoA dehydrogenase
MQNGMKNPDDAGAASTDYLHLSGLVALGYMWCRMVKAAQEKLGGDGSEANDFYQNKITTGRYFMERVMPETAAHVARITSGSATMMALPAEAF